jgi:Zn-dependent peptidase ImmA (M78 family)/transcriptional regulator with XRE-family HTH domain
MSAALRVKQAREYCGLTQTELARRAGVSQSAIAQIEAGRTNPSPQVLEAIAFQTGFPLSFFRRESLLSFPLGSLIFRARRAMTERERAQLHRHGEVVYEAVTRLTQKVEMVPLRLPRLNRGDFTSPAHAATLTRTALGASPDAPFPNLINAIERAGVFVLPIPLRSEHAEAYSLWSDGQPVIVTFSDVPGDRLRMSVAHELGHLVMHQQLVGDDKQREQEAFEFAGELLIPEQAARSEMILPLTLSTLAPLKPRWGIAISALIMRAARLDIITSRQQRYLFQQMSQRGWRTREPSNLDVRPEKPRAFRKMAELLYGATPDYRRLAGDLNLPLPLIRNVLEGGATLTEMPRVGRVAQPEPAQQMELPDNVRDLAEHRNRQSLPIQTTDSA